MTPDCSQTWQVQAHTSPHGIQPEHWNALLMGSAAPTPFMRHEWLSALHDSACASPATGWSPLFLSAHAPGDALDAPPRGVCALYLKNHSRGEYVFDWAWADAYQRHGLAYYPKLLCASPFTPVPGSRLLASSPETRVMLLQAMTQYARAQGLSSAHVLFPDEADREAAQAQGWLIRHGVQFHWRNRVDSPYVDLPDFLASLQRDKRKKIQQERRRVADAGVQVQARLGTDIRPEDWDFFYHCYRNTYLAHGGPPYLSREFFAQVAQRLSDHWLMFTASREGQPVAASLVGVDLAQGVAWGRYWGCIEPIDCLHFELCYYAPLSWCIAQGFQRFEGGAQGEHKMARGLMPEPTCSAHWLADPRFAGAVEDFLAQEGAGISAYVDELKEHSPYKG